jgi:hypothetical protein
MAELPKPAHPQWKPIVDEVYLQETGRSVETTQPLTSVAVYNGQVYLGHREGLWLLKDDQVEILKGGPRFGVYRLKVLAGSLWAVAADGLWKYDGTSWSKPIDNNVSDVCLHNGQLVAAGTGLFVLEDGAPKPLVRLEKDERPPELHGVASYAGALYVHDGRRVLVLEGDQLSDESVADWGKLPPGATLRDMHTADNRLILATDKGLAVLRGMTWYTIRGEDGLCCEDTVCLAPGFADDLWIGTMRGAVRHVDDQYQYFGHQRWIPHNKVNAIACGPDVVYLATERGVGIIRYEPYTLAKKAAWYEQWLDSWGQKRLGFIHSLVLKEGNWLRHVSDNDVGHSAHYLAAQCFKYAATGDEAARATALDMMKTVKWSEEITPLEGFPARSVWVVGEEADKAMHGSGGYPAEWHPTTDGTWEWKADTSSDELIAQVYETMLFLELAANDQDRVWATEHLDRVIGHILREGWVLRDVDGKPTRWARWDPEYLQSPEGVHERGLNALEAFAFLAAAAHFTGDAKYEAGKRQLIDWGYPQAVLRQKVTFPPAWYTHFDDRLAFLAYYPLLTYETDPALHRLWERSLERSWEIKRIDGAPWFHFLYGAMTGHDCENRRAISHLREWPLDLRMYSYTNSQRNDLLTPKGYTMYSERVRSFSPRETGPLSAGSDYLMPDQDGKGQAVADPGGWLECYWMARYFGFLAPPSATDENLLAVPKPTQPQGAKPYTGPPRPKLRHEQASAASG